MTLHFGHPAEQTDDAGFTFVETVVVMILLAAIGLVTTTVLVGTFRRQGEMDTRATALTLTRQALQRTLRDIRAANLLGLDATRLQETITTSAGVTRTLTYSVTTSAGVTSLVLDERDVNSANQALPAIRRKTLISHLVNSASQPVFRAVAPVPGYTTTVSGVDPQTCVIAGQTPTAYARDCVGTVQLRLVVDPVDAVTAKSLCAPRGVPADCYLDLSDSADIRNNA
jgi:type II secretory pathway pseudopilin PulG